MRSNKIALAAALALAGLAVSGCRYGHPGHDSDRHHGHHRGDGDRDGNR
ncbi:hypothetical protein NDN01_14725 [Sphingomonas sp. QA11]|nr:MULTISPECIES: hypothetical protein [unclassified Sphingomonas]WCM25319.1 hypothetical protein NDN01_14725 [Sphingomonas sp. QA11]WEJ99915.1 MAG: hypothetical protein P0Y59_23975 [Sphingomonas sp.]